MLPDRPRPLGPATHPPVLPEFAIRRLLPAAIVIIAAAWGLDATALPRLPADAIETIRASDTRIVGALHERDAARTRRLVEVHLEITLEWWSALHSH